MTGPRRRNAGRGSRRLPFLLLAFLLAFAILGLLVPTSAQPSAGDPNLCPPVAPTLATDQLPRIVKDDLGPDMLAFTISSPRVRDRRLEVYLGNDPASTVCSRSAVYSTDFSTCADLYLLRDTWENLKKCGWDTREDAANLVLNNTIHVRVYDNVKNPLGGYYTHTTGLKAPVTVSFAKDADIPDDSDEDGDSNPDTPDDNNDDDNVDDGSPDDVGLDDPEAIPADPLVNQNAYRVVKLAVDNSLAVRQSGPRRLYIFIAASYFNPYVLSPRSVDVPSNVQMSQATTFIVAAPDCADNAPTGATLCTRGGEIVVTLADGICDVGGNYTVTYDRCQDLQAAPDADPTDPGCQMPYQAQFAIPEGTSVCSDPELDLQALSGISVDVQPDKGQEEPNYRLGTPVNLVVQAGSEQPDAPLTTIILVGVSVTSSADGVARDLVKDEQPTDLGQETQIVWPQPIDVTTGQAVISFTPTYGNTGAMLPEANFQGERQFGATVTVRLYYPMQGNSDDQRRKRMLSRRSLISRWYGNAEAEVEHALKKRQEDVPAIEELVELDTSAAFNIGINFDTSTPTEDPDPGETTPTQPDRPQYTLPPPAGGPNEWSGRPADFWSSGALGYLTFGFACIALITTWIKASAGGDTVAEVAVESARPRIFNILPSFLDVFFLAQHLFMLGCLNLGTTDVINRFAANFKWSVLVFKVPFLQSLASSIYATNGYYTYPTEGDYPRVPRRLEVRQYQGGREHIAKGMEATAFEIGINLGDYFITSFFLFLIIMASLLLLGALSLFVLEIRHEVNHVAKYRALRSSIVTWTFSSLVRFFYLMYMPMTLFCVFQMSYDNKNDYVPWYMTFWCTIVFAAALIALPAYICYKIFSTWPRDGLHTNDRRLVVLGTFYSTLRINKLWFMFVDFAYRFLSGIFVGMAFTNGYVQSSLWAVVILTYAIMIGIHKPYSRKERNWYQIIQCGVMLFSLILLWSCNPQLSYETRQNLSFTTTIILCGLMVLVGLWIMFSLWKTIVYYAAVKKEGRANGFDSMELDGNVDYSQAYNGGNKTYNADGEYSDDTAVDQYGLDEGLHSTDEDKLLSGYNPEPVTLSFGNTSYAPSSPTTTNVPTTQRSRWSVTPAVAGVAVGAVAASSASRSVRKSKTLTTERNDSNSELVPNFDDIMRMPRNSRYGVPSTADEVNASLISQEDPSARANAQLESVSRNMKVWSSSRGSPGTYGSKSSGSYLDESGR